jgi:hypothetical protein
MAATSLALAGRMLTPFIAQCAPDHDPTKVDRTVAEGYIGAGSFSKTGFRFSGSCFGKENAPAEAGAFLHSRSPSISADRQRGAAA